MNNNDKDIIKIEGRLTGVMFPKTHRITGTEYAVSLWNVLELKEGDIPKEAYKGGEITINGNFPIPVTTKNSYIILAKKTVHKKYGVQYELLYINEGINLSNLSNQKAFLSKILAQSQIDELYKTYENPLEIIANHDINALTKVKGIKFARANQIIKRYEANKDYSNIYIELDEYDFTPTFIQKLTRSFDNPNTLIETVKQHPYQLINMVDGIGFKKADEIAERGGLDSHSPERIAAFVQWYLESIAEEGNSYITALDLNQAILMELGSDIVIKNEEEGTSNVSKAIKSLVEEGIIKIEENDNKARRRVYLTKIYNLEKEIALHLNRLASAPNQFLYDNWEEAIKQLEQKQGFTFAQEQKDGIKLGLDNSICLISGLAGSGKSSLVSGILAALPGKSFAQCALSGKAAARLQEVTGVKGSTIHRLLGYNPVDGFFYNKSNPLPYDIIILDEVSLVGGDIFLKLIEAIPTGSKLIMLGDMGQLPSIGKLNLAADMCNSKYIPSVSLTEVHRQAEQSGILSSAYNVRNQYQLFSNTYEGKVTVGELQDMMFDIRIDNTRIRDSCIDWFEEWYNDPNDKLIKQDIMNVQIIAPVKTRGDACVFNLNNDIQEIVNPLNPNSNEETLSVVLDKGKIQKIHVNDKVMCIKNNYEVYNDQNNTTEIFNGWVGKVKSIDHSADCVVVDFPLAEGEVYMTCFDAEQDLVLGYASTVHKLQGSDAPLVIGVLDYDTPPSMLNCQLVYTLLTRAKKCCVLVAQNGALAKAIATNNIPTKRTFLVELLEEQQGEKENGKTDYSKDSIEENCENGNNGQSV